MATSNRFDLLRDDDSDNDAVSQQKKSAAKLPPKPLPSAEPVMVAKSEGARGGGRGYGRRDGGGYDRRDGGGYDRDSSRSEKSFGSGGSGGGQAAIRETDSGRTFQRRGGYGGPQTSFRGEHCGDYSINKEGQRDRPPRVFERWRGTGRGNEYKPERAGRGNRGLQTDELSQVTENVTIECKKNVDSEKPSVEDGNKEKQGNKQGKARKSKEKPAQPEQKEREDMSSVPPRLIMQHFAFPEDHIIELDLRSEDQNVYTNFIDQVRSKRCMHVFRILRNGKLQFMANVGTTLGHNVEVEQLGFVVRLISKDESLDVLLERKKIYVVACRRSPDGMWIVLRGEIWKLVKKFLTKSQLASIASTPTGERYILEPFVMGVGTSYASLSFHSGADRNVIKMNRGRLIEAVRVLCECSSNKEDDVKNEIVAGPISDIAHSIPEPVRFPAIQKHVSDNYFKDDNSALRLPGHLVAMINMWTSASRSTLCSLLGIKRKDIQAVTKKGKDIQAVTKKCPFIKADVDRLDEYALTYAESPPLSPPPPAFSSPPPASLSTQSSSTSPFTQPRPIFTQPRPIFPWLGPPSTSPCMGSMPTSLCTLPFQVGRPPLSSLSTTAPVDQLLPVSHVTSSSAFREFPPQLPPASSLVPYTHLPNFSPALHSGPSPLAFSVDPSFLGQAHRFGFPPAYLFVNPSPAPVGPATDMPGILSSTYQPQPPQYLSQQYPTTSVHLHTSVVSAPGSSPFSTSPRPQNL